MEDLPSYFDLILSRQAFLWMPHTLDLCKVFDLIPYDNLNWYDTPSLWQMLKGLKNDKQTRRSECSSEQELGQVGAALE